MASGETVDYAAKWSDVTAEELQSLSSPGRFPELDPKLFPAGLPPTGVTVMDVLEASYMNLDNVPIFKKELDLTPKVPMYPPSCQGIAPERFFLPEVLEESDDEGDDVDVPDVCGPEDAEQDDDTKTARSSEQTSKEIGKASRKEQSKLKGRKPELVDEKFWKEANEKMRKLVRPKKILEERLPSLLAFDQTNTGLLEICDEVSLVERVEINQQTGKEAFRLQEVWREIPGRAPVPFPSHLSDKFSLDLNTDKDNFEMDFDDELIRAGLEKVEALCDENVVLPPVLEKAFAARMEKSAEDEISDVSDTEDPGSAAVVRDFTMDFTEKERNLFGEMRISDRTISYEKPLEEVLSEKWLIKADVQSEKCSGVATVAAEGSVPLSSVLFAPAPAVGTGQKESVTAALPEEPAEQEEPPKPPMVLKIPSISAADEASYKAGRDSTKFAFVVNLDRPNTGLSRQPYPPYTFPFKLDPFQEEALKCVDNGRSVMVAAHTSAGKTVVAEYAVSICLRNRTRAIYTSPIKALSNQKFRDLYNTFQDVGLVTGDCQINDTASCLIMTTEILRSMLYNGHHIVPDIQWVIFDECHYINDAERGVVWEETLIMLPPAVSVILLSATVPNVVQFADWVGSIRKTPVFVIQTTKRPVPLEYYLYTGCGGKSRKDCFKFLSADGRFLKDGYDRAKAKIDERTDGRGGNSGYSDKQEKTLWQGLVSYLQEQDQLPVVAFTLSRNRCDSNASLLSSLDLTTAKQKGEIRAFLNKSLSILKRKDRFLPQVVRISDLVARGIAVHHSGILPILKEVIEILFARGFVKLLFATETFAMGVNMPARTVVFDDFRKYDGKGWRELLPSEYIQMAGRAGRRGLDAVGKAILVCKRKLIDVQALVHMTTGKPAALESQFRVTYAMVLCVLRSESMKIEDMMQRSFLEAQKERQRPKMQKEVEGLKEELDKLPSLTCSLCCTDMEKFHGLAQSILEMRERLGPLLVCAGQSSHLLQPGRLIFFSSAAHGLFHYPAVVLRVMDKNLNVLTVTESSFKASRSLEQDRCQLMASLRALAASTSASALASPPYSFPAASWDGNCVPVSLSIHVKDVLGIGRTTLKVPTVQSKNLLHVVQARNSEGLEAIAVALQSWTDFSRLDPVRDLGLKSIENVFEIQAVDQFEREIRDCVCIECPNFEEHLQLLDQRHRLRCRIEKLEKALSRDSLLMLPDYAMKHAVLLKLGHLKSVRRRGAGDEATHSILSPKGHATCELGTHDLLISQLIFTRFWDDFSPPELAGLLSAFVFQGKGEAPSKEDMPEKLLLGINGVEQQALELGKVEVECGYEGSAVDRIDQLNFGLTRVAHDWAMGVPFVKLMSETDVQEGLIVRTIQRLEELVRDIRNACGVLGHTDLRMKFSEVSDAIRRDIVFAPSLYTQEVEENLQRGFSESDDARSAV
ncbi:unnamed protein product [Cyprideis torosa]|uniref:Uncharacterized protein n=1 Tax=Cyprideis torosa TaxID=163714 RepID=A0A7R8ZPU4_9CRUS|nr:unnamed protein product [Cyprideis torosa]CAG0890655.1 unnamed protein product [Cyprideis torosa]